MNSSDFDHQCPGCGDFINPGEEHRCNTAYARLHTNDLNAHAALAECEAIAGRRKEVMHKTFEILMAADTEAPLENLLELLYAARELLATELDR